MNLRAVNFAACIAVALCWLAFVKLFAFQHRRSSETPTRRDRRSLIGIAFQGLGFAAIWAVRRPWLSPFLPLPGVMAALPALLSVALAVASCWLSYAAVRTLGKEWSFEARLVDGHRLVTAGPYDRMRHPIYSAMLGYLLATGLAVSHWLGMVIGVAFFGVGTAIRTRSEEKLLRAQFGREYEEYARRVPAILPRLHMPEGMSSRS